MGFLRPLLNIAAHDGMATKTLGAMTNTSGMHWLMQSKWVGTKWEHICCPFVFLGGGQTKGQQRNPLPVSAFGSNPFLLHQQVHTRCL
jgi:hypothetical protein